MPESRRSLPLVGALDARRATLLVIAAAVVIVGAVAVAGIEFESSRAPDGSVALPAELDGPARITDEQRDALARFDPDRIRCDPAGCESWRLRFDHAPVQLTVSNGWLAAIDGTVLRIRRLEGDGDGDLDLDLAGRLPALAWHDADDGTGHLDVIATPPEQLLVLPDGEAVLRWFDRLVVLERDGAVRWEVTSDDRSFRYIDAVDGRLLVLRDDLPWPQGTTGPRPSGDPILASVHDLHDGGERWQRYTLSPRDVMAGGLLITTVEGGLEMVDLEDGTTRWVRPRRGNERVQSTTGPWVVLTGAQRATLLDAATGREVAGREGSALLTPLQRIGELWIAAWLDGSLGDGAARAAVVALDDDGRERWQTPITGLGRGACCSAAIPWVDGTIAVHDPASPIAPWRTLDVETGAAVDLPTDRQPRLPLAPDDPNRVSVSSLAMDRFVQEQDGRIAVLTAEGRVRVHGGDDLEVVALDPFVVRQGDEVVGVQPVPADPPG